MISRVAESCFWLNRYVERVESTARLAAVNRVVILDAGIQQAARWKPVIVITGEHKRFEELVGAGAYDKDEEAEAYLTWSEENPTSIRSSLAAARENARMTREVVSREVWETLNATWQWLNGREAHKEYKRDREKFYQQLRRTCAEFQGDCHGTMLRDQPFFFMRMGTALERAIQTALAMGIKAQWVGRAGKKKYETAEESAQWMALLRLLSAVEPFFKRHSRAPTGSLVAQFILQDPGFSRSPVHCFDSALRSTALIEAATKRTKATKTTSMLRAAAKRLRSEDFGQSSGTDLHEQLGSITGEVEAICMQVYADFCDPALSSVKPTRRSNAASTSPQP